MRAHDSPAITTLVLNLDITVAETNKNVVTLNIDGSHKIIEGPLIDGLLGVDINFMDISIFATRVEFSTFEDERANETTLMAVNGSSAFSFIDIPNVNLRV